MPQNVGRFLLGKMGPHSRIASGKPTFELSKEQIVRGRNTPNLIKTNVVFKRTHFRPCGYFMYQMV
jgi:hypothetical protein